MARLSPRSFILILAASVIVYSSTCGCLFCQNPNLLSAGAYKDLPTQSKCVCGKHQLYLLGAGLDQAYKHKVFKGGGQAACSPISAKQASPERLLRCFRSWISSSLHKHTRTLLGASKDSRDCERPELNDGRCQGGQESVTHWYSPLMEKSCCWRSLSDPPPHWISLTHRMR